MREDIQINTAGAKSVFPVTGGAPFANMIMLPAGHGDALWIKYGHQGAPTSRVLVDWRHHRELHPSQSAHFESAAVRAPRRFFLMLHIDSDHIGGALPFLADVDGLGVRFDDLWFNGRKHLGLQGSQNNLSPALLS